MAEKTITCTIEGGGKDGYTLEDYYGSDDENECGYSLVIEIRDNAQVTRFVVENPFESAAVEWEDLVAGKPVRLLDEMDGGIESDGTRVTLSSPATRDYQAFCASVEIPHSELAPAVASALKIPLPPGLIGGIKRAR